MAVVTGHVHELATHLLDRQHGVRQLIAIVGPPGSGKTTLSHKLCRAINQANSDSSAVVSMDGFHLDDAMLQERALIHRKGAPETFDIGGLIHLHQRLAANAEDEIAIPVFDRSMELSRAGACLIGRNVETVLIEGNYLLLERPGWQNLAAFYGTTIHIQVREGVLERRLIQRWQDHGFSLDEARQKVQNNDWVNAKRVIAQSKAADILYRPILTTDKVADTPFKQRS